MDFLGFPQLAIFLPLIILLAVWEAVWKAIALWRAGRNGNLVWFICIFVINTLGILPIIYIFGFSRRPQTPQPLSPSPAQPSPPPAQPL